MKEFNYILNYLGLGISISEETSPILQFCIVIMVLAIIALLCFINIMIYIGILYISSKIEFLNKLPKHWLFQKWFNLYISTRFGFLIFEIILFLINILGIIYLCGRIVYGLS